MSHKVFVTLLLVAGIAAVATADIFGDLLGFDIVGTLTGESQEKNSNVKGQREEEEESNSTCECEGNGCNCCVDFNLTTIIDLGGPGCVKMRYLSQKEGVALNVSYGDSLLHSQVVKQNDKKGSCMDLLSELAQICARFDSLKPRDNGLEGCLHFEPHVLGQVTSKYHIGCFKMSADGMVQDESMAAAEEKPQEEEAEEEEQETKPAEAGENEEDDDDGSSILDVVNHSAEQGIAFFTDLLGIKIPGKKNKNTTTEKPKEEVTEAAAEESEEESRDDESRKFQNHRSRFLGRVKTNLV